MQEASETEKGLFDEALALTDPAEREAFLLAACPDNEVRRCVESLLEAHDEAGSFMQAPQNDFSAAPICQASPEALGTVIDRYKLLEKLGEGGFGIVWAAEQREPVKRRVALKIIKLGMDTRQVVARFEAERQALALMDHANIAKVFDAGATDTGRPFFVMELVRGIAITKYCDQERLTTEARLDLFMKVCHAIQHAHQKGIIHRDIKPSNILVTLHDGVPVPKVIDFGVAKAIQHELTEKTIYTQLAQFIGTPAYMSPEQAEMSGLDIDTRSDIYSLGVLLYELLTGVTPFDAKELMRSGLDQMRKIIREQEPLTPSSRLTQLQKANITDSKHSALRIPNSAFDRDLDWIVMKCLEKDRTRRYETASGLAQDLKRHLENEPVLARPPSAAYRFQKAWRRNKLVYTAGVAVLLALAAGLTLAALGWFQALTQRDAADLARAGEEAQRIQAKANEEKAIQERRKAELATEETRRRAYVSEINAAFHALDDNSLERAIELLNRQRPKKPGELDLRGFEWRLLWQRCRPDEKVTLPDAGASSVAFSPDGRWLAYGGDRIVIHELPSQSEVKTIPNAATTLAFSPDGKLLASGHDTNVKLWSTESWQEQQSLPDARYPAVFSPDGKWLVTGTPGGYQDGRWLANIGRGGYLVWSDPEGTENWERKGYCAGGPTYLYQSRQGVAFSPDQKLLVTAGHRGGREVAQFQVWDFPSLIARKNFESPRFRLASAAFAPDGKHLLIGDSVGGLMVWDVAEGRVVETLREHTGAIKAITYSRGGQTFATCGADRTILLWDAAKRKVLVRLRGHLEEVCSVAISPDGRMLASGSVRGKRKLWDASTRHERRMLQGSIDGFSADSRLLMLQEYQRGDIVNGYRLTRLADDVLIPIPLDDHEFNGLDTWADAFKANRLLRLEDGVLRTIPLDDYKFRGLITWADIHGITPHAVFGRINGFLEYWDLATMWRLQI